MYGERYWTDCFFETIFPESSFNFLAFLFAVTLKNAAELLEFSAMYNAEQLKLSCLQFIALNIAALLESKWEQKKLSALYDDISF